MSELTIEARYEKATGHKLPIGYANPDNGYDEDWVALVLEFAQNELNTRPNDAKIDDKLFMECFDKWVPDIDEMEQPADIDNDDVYAWCRNVLNMYLGIVCKQSSEGE